MMTFENLNPMFGRKHSEETKQKIRDMRAKKNDDKIDL